MNEASDISGPSPTRYNLRFDEGVSEDMGLVHQPQMSLQAAAGPSQFQLRQRARSSSGSSDSRDLNNLELRSFKSQPDPISPTATITGRSDLLSIGSDTGDGALEQSGVANATNRMQSINEQRYRFDQKLQFLIHGPIQDPAAGQNWEQPALACPFYLAFEHLTGFMDKSCGSCGPESNLVSLDLFTQHLWDVHLQENPTREPDPLKPLQMTWTQWQSIQTILKSPKLRGHVARLPMDMFWAQHDALSLMMLQIWDVLFPQRTILYGPRFIYHPREVHAPIILRSAKYMFDTIYITKVQQIAFWTGHPLTMKSEYAYDWYVPMLRFAFWVLLDPMLHLEHQAINQVYRRNFTAIHYQYLRNLIDSRPLQLLNKLHYSAMVTFESIYYQEALKASKLGNNVFQPTDNHYLAMITRAFTVVLFEEPLLWWRMLRISHEELQRATVDTDWVVSTPPSTPIMPINLRVETDLSRFFVHS